MHSFGTQTQKNNNTCFGACLYSMGYQYGNLHQLFNDEQGDLFYSVGPTGISVLTQEKNQRGFGKNAFEWTSG